MYFGLDESRLTYTVITLIHYSYDKGPLSQRNLVFFNNVYIRFLQTELYGTFNSVVHTTLVLANKFMASFLSIYLSFSHGIDRIFLKVKKTLQITNRCLTHPII